MNGTKAIAAGTLARMLQACDPKEMLMVPEQLADEVQKATRHYPLMLDEKGLAITLWSTDGTHCWTIGHWRRHSEGYDLVFLGSRPLDTRVDWVMLREVVVIGQALADERFKAEAD